MQLMRANIPHNLHRKAEAQKAFATYTRLLVERFKAVSVLLNDNDPAKLTPEQKAAIAKNLDGIETSLILSAMPEQVLPKLKTVYPRLKQSR